MTTVLSGATPWATAPDTSPAAVVLPVLSIVVVDAATPSTREFMLPMLIPMVWPAFEPIWKVFLLKEPSRIFMLLNWVVPAMRSISEDSCSTSKFRFTRSSALLVSLADCTASSRMRCKMLVTSSIPPSAVWVSDIASLAFLIAMFRPRICESMREEMLRPAASSAAELMRVPVDRRCIAVDNWRLLIVKASCACKDFRLVLITDMWNSFSNEYINRYGRRRRLYDRMHHHKL